MGILEDIKAKTELLDLKGEKILSELAYLTRAVLQNTRARARRRKLRRRIDWRHRTLKRCGSRGGDERGLTYGGGR